MKKLLTVVFTTPKQPKKLAIGTTDTWALNVVLKSCIKKRMVSFSFTAPEALCQNTRNLVMGDGPAVL